MSPAVTINGRAVLIEHVHPPVPLQHFDFRASLADSDGLGPQGYGWCASQALADLFEKIEADKEQL